MRNHRFLSIAFMACASLACAGFAAVQSVIVSAYQFAKGFVLDGFALAAGEGKGIAKPGVMLVQAKAFVVRLAKRERPVMTGSWRMCPST